MQEKIVWFRDPAFWVVFISFIVFTATAASIVWNLEVSYPKNRQLQIVQNNARAQASLIPSLEAKKFTVDARSFSKWVYFSLSKGKIVHPLYVSSMNWDLAFKRYHMIANGGAANIASRGGILDLGNVPFQQVKESPKKGYLLDTLPPGGSKQDLENRAIYHWYLYDYSTHVLTPAGHVYIVRTPDYHYYKIKILNYYCKNMQAGCITFEYQKL